MATLRVFACPRRKFGDFLWQMTVADHTSSLPDCKGHFKGIFYLCYSGFLLKVAWNIVSGSMMYGYWTWQKWLGVAPTLEARNLLGDLVILRYVDLGLTFNFCCFPLFWSLEVGTKDMVSCVNVIMSWSHFFSVCYMYTKFYLNLENYDNNGVQFLQNFIFSSLTDSEKLN